MNKTKLFLIAITMLLFIRGNAQSFYDLSFKSLKGDSIYAALFASKKVMIIVLPVEKEDSIYDQLDSFIKRYGDSIVIIGVPSIEAGYNIAKSGNLKHRLEKSNVLVAEGMYSSKASGVRQSSIMQWLTDYQKNGHFNNDALLPGCKFFVNENGRMYAAFNHKTSLQAPIIERVMKASGKPPAKR